LPESVTWVRECSNTTTLSIFDYYLQADLFVFPTWDEQLGLVLCEAISTGLPVIARDVGGISEFVFDEQEWLSSII
jgi:glycosyltransferase involved in cell wall biosynthesis